MAILGAAVALATRLSSTLRDWQVAEEYNLFRAMLQEQLDLRFEAQMLLQFARNSASTKAVRFPHVFFAASDCLVESEERGIPMQSFIAGVRDGRLRERVAELGLSAFAKMLLWDNLVHADLHPGNMVVRVYKHGSRTDFFESVSDLNKQHNNGGADVELVFMDAGLVTQLSERDHLNFVLLFKALVVDGDGRKAGRLLITRIPQPTVRDADEFCDKIGAVAEPVLRARFRFHRGLDLGAVLGGVLAAVREHRVRLDPAFTNLVWSMVCVEGVGRQLAPRMDLQPILLRSSLQFVVTAAARQIAARVDEQLNG